VTGCSGSPKLCEPTWTSDAAYPSQSIPAIANNGIAFLSVQAVGISGFLGPRIVSFDTNGPNGSEPWMFPDVGTVFIGGSVLYVENGDSETVDAYDATGTTGCAVGVCNLLWSSPHGFGTGLIANGTLYVGGANASNKGEVLAYGLP
jgi:outer membrane protein assembly factor BamB